MPTVSTAPTADPWIPSDGVTALTAVPVRVYRRAPDAGFVEGVPSYSSQLEYLPSLEAMAAAMRRSSRLHVQVLEEIGPHYADTLRRWREAFDERLDDVRALGYDDRFIRTWEYYLAFCEAGFRERLLRDVQVVLARPGR